MVLPEYLHFSSRPDQIVRELVESMDPDHVAVLVDENTQTHCLPLLKCEYDVIEISSGEVNKTLDTCTQIWSKLTDLGFSRNSLLINVGGGVIGDMGGFAASTYKRGIRFIHFPTTLLSMVDASIGGKLGVDFNGLKNHIGVFREPDAVVVCSMFLKTLPERQLNSGFAEVLKHGLISEKKYWDLLKERGLQGSHWDQVIMHSIKIKEDVVISDPLESGRRKILNFGHTLGHAIETYYLGTTNSLLHGEAIAVGMVLEGHLSMQKLGLSKEELNEIVTVLKRFYGLPKLPELSELTGVLHQDKKNKKGNLNFSLLDTIGNCHYDVVVTLDEISLAIDFYHDIR